MRPGRSTSFDPDLRVVPGYLCRAYAANSKFLAGRSRPAASQLLDELSNPGFGARREIDSNLLILAVLGWVLVLIAGCTQSNSADEPAAASSIPVGVERFLLFPNSAMRASGDSWSNTADYAQAYYAAIDPNDEKDTFAKWKAANRFGTGGEEQLAVFRDVRDLGYGRRMTGRRNVDGSVAFSVENYQVSIAPSGYSAANADAAIAPDPRWHVNTNAIEWSCDPAAPGENPATCRKFAKFFNFSPTGQRHLLVDLDGRGPKAMPGPCLTCHGGRADPLTPVDPAIGKRRFALVNNALSGKRGDILGKLQPFHVDSFEWSGASGFTRADQEATLKKFNEWVLCTYPLPGGGGAGKDACRPTAGPSEWEGTAAELIKAWYGGPDLPRARFSDTYVPAGWTGHESLYLNVIAPYCRACHILRGAGVATAAPPPPTLPARAIDIGQKRIDFSTEAGFRAYADRSKVHVVDRGDMPLALLVYRRFWESSAPAALAAYLDSVPGAGTATAGGGVALRPGRPIADPGPNRMVRAAVATTLTAADSLFASSYSWSVTATPIGGNAVLSNAGNRDAGFVATVAGDYTVQLTVTNGSASDSKNLVVSVSSSFPDPASIRFADVLNLFRKTLQDNNLHCADCHTQGGVPNNPPIAYTDIDRNGDGVIDATDEAWLLEELRGRVNLREIAASPLLRRPTGYQHGRAFNLTLPATGLTHYSELYHWIMNGMPTGGVYANAGPDTVVTFSPSTTDIALDRTTSFGGTSYIWSIQSGPAGATIIGADTSIGTATLRVQGTGVYVVQLQASDGTLTDTATRQITVN
jgi:mono/diheme cytochrome c family protein